MSGPVPTGSLYRHQRHLDSKLMYGLLAPGRSGTFTDEYAIAESDGSEVVFTVNRFDEGFFADPTAWLVEDPGWTGRIE